MKPVTTDDVLDLMDASFTSAALCAALELGLFWLLESRPLDAKSVAIELGIPPLRCYYWLQLLCRTGLIEESSHGYKSSSKARTPACPRKGAHAALYRAFEGWVGRRGGFAPTEAAIQRRQLRGPRVRRRKGSSCLSSRRPGRRRPRSVAPRLLHRPTTSVWAPPGR